ncbi:igE-binding protein-like [Rattus rattus]|uniref:igE-binding protein-like n=1 Tax=Rattus rattus TaxID=10117 RepID=UPI0013F2E891|nr:igE-binding protein-like [Rattus rattus]
MVALAALGLFLLTFEFLVTAKRRQRSRGNCPAVTAKRRALGEGRGGASETGLDSELKSLKRKGAPKKKGPSNAEAREWGKNAPGEIKQRREKKVLKSRSLYPVKDSKTSELDSSETDELSSSEGEDLEDEAARCEKERHYPDEQRANSLGKQKEVGGGNHAVSQPISPCTPPSYMERFHSDSFLTKEEQKKIQQTFPVFEAADGGRVHAPVEYVQIKELAESVRNYGVSANFTIAQVERLANLAMTPGDWQTTVKDVLPNMGQYVEWKALWYDASQAQAKVNAIAEGNQRDWTLDLLTGQGQYANNQTNYDWGAYAQISAAAVKAWKALSKKGESGGHLTRIIQAPREPFSDFVARMMEAAGRIFGDPEQAMPLVEQLVYEQATQECRAAITPRKSKGLQDWLRVCRELGGPLTNASLAAAILQGQKCSGTGDRKVCYNCGKPGHLKKECQALTRKRAPGLCTKCGKGYHWASECRSVKDIRGRLIQPEPPQAEEGENIPKNGYLGPRSQSPKTYGTPAYNRRTPRFAEPQETQQEWTSVPPPNSY